MINWIWFESIQLKKSAINGYITDKMKRFHCTTSGHCIGFLWQKFRFWPALKKKHKIKDREFVAEVHVVLLSLELRKISCTSRIELLTCPKLDYGGACLISRDV